MENSLESVYVNIIGHLNESNVVKSKKLDGGITVAKNGSELMISYKDITLVVEQLMTEDGEYFNYMAFNEFDCPIKTIQLDMEQTENPIELFKEWVDSGFPSEEDISAYTGKPFSGSIKDLRKMIRLRNTMK